MKKVLPIIVGIAGGIIISLTGIGFYQMNVAYGELNWWNEVTAFGNFFDWKDVFGPSSKGKDLYTLIYSKHFVVPEKSALTDVAKNYGLTTTEAKSVVGGSIVPLLNTSYKRSPSMTQEQAMQIMQNVQDSYLFLSESYALQQEADTSIRPNEIFANNDLSDSGFDLIYDLSKIEEVLFVNVVPNSIGKPYVDALKSPYVPTQDDYKIENYVAGEADLFSGYKVDLPANTSGTSNISASAGTNFGEQAEQAAGKAIMALGDKNVIADVLQKDTCAATDTVAFALENYEKEAVEKSSGKTSSGDEKTGGVIGGDSLSGGGTDEDKPKEAETKNTTQENLTPAPKDNWMETWCPEDPNVPSGGDSYGGLGATFGDSGFTSLGDVGNSLLDNSSGTLAGAGVGFSSKGFSAQASVCLTVKLVKKTLTSYYPGKSCVLCEVKKINETLKKTLDHSLIPNKVTGNLMESAKCKSAIEVPLIDMKFVLIEASIPTPSGNDAIFGKNIFESWRKFVDRYRPLLFSYSIFDTISKAQLENAPSAITQDKIFSEIQKEFATATAEANKNISDIEMSESATNTALYAQTLIKELDFMTQTFEKYKNLLEKTNNVCQEWGKKPDIQ
ncbi:MAG: hypothetical protein WC651_03770 [Candidatus Gracilibacteria bacterium]|jgi:hypothetical protein